MGKRSTNNYIKLYADLETVAYKGQTDTEAWSSAYAGKILKEARIYHSLQDSWNFIKSIRQNAIIYYHNLKFDGMYWIDFFERYNVLKQARYTDEKGITRLKKVKDLKHGEYTYIISSKGIWYAIYINWRDIIIEFRDSLKLLPFKLKKIGEDFKTQHQKLEMEYEGFRYAGCNITDEEKAYIINDVLLLKEALEIMEEEGHTQMTIGSCCMSEYKKIMGKEDMQMYFPNLYKDPIGAHFFHQPINFSYSSGEYILKSYRGAFCDVGENHKKKVVKNGYTLDVTSLYPSVMHSKSGNYYPIGLPLFWIGKDYPDCFKRNPSHYYYFVRFKCSFRVKENHIPFIQIKGDWRYKATEHLKTSDLYDRKTGEYYSYRIVNGEKIKHTVILTMCQDEFELFKEQYNIYDFEILDGCIFYKEIGLFDEYIDKYFAMKSNSKGARKAMAKLYLNNLYGKFATSPDSSYKLLTMGEDGVLHYSTVLEAEKTPGYIAVGSAITAKARCFTIRAAQKNIECFCYADTDSLHLTGRPTDAKGVTIADNELCTWKLESEWEEGYFTRQKTYIEKDKSGKYNITCAGMPERCKDLFRVALTHDQELIKDLGKLDDDEEEYIKKSVTLKDFEIGLKIPSKLYSKIIKGGTILYKDFYEMH